MSDNNPLKDMLNDLKRAVEEEANKPNDVEAHWGLKKDDFLTKETNKFLKDLVFCPEKFKGENFYPCAIIDEAFGDIKDVETRAKIFAFATAFHISMPMLEARKKAHKGL